MPSVEFDLFPEIAKQVAEKPLRSKRVAAAKAHADSAPANPKPAKALAAEALPAAHKTPISKDELEAMAQLLEAHGDYRLQRRLQPVLHWPGACKGQRLRLVMLDTETTGLDSSKDSIIELAMLRVDIDSASGLPVGAVDVYDGLQDPGKPIPPEVVALTGIHDADVRGQQLDEARVRNMLEGVDLVVAHNAGFDRPFVERRMAEFAQLRWACSVAEIDWKAEGRSSAKLESLAQAHGWFYDAHRAEMDCHALLAVLAQTLPQAGHTGLAHLLAAASQPSYALQATNAPFEAKDLLKSRGYRWNAEQRVWHTRLSNAAALKAECAWLKANVYGRRNSTVQVEQCDALVRFSQRSGVVQTQAL